jgi:Tfp pilus assembly protein PilP
MRKLPVPSKNGTHDARRAKAKGVGRASRSLWPAMAGCAWVMAGTLWLAEALAAEPAKGGEKPPSTAAPAPAAKPSAPPAAPAAARPPNSAEALAQRLTVLRRKVLREEDFAENDDANRDPFRSYLDTWIDRGPKVTVTTVSAICAKYSLDELTLIAVISGDANPRGMFRDPTGLGQVVKRGDYLSKSAARVTKILSDRVVLEMSEMTPGGTTKALERAVLVNPEGTDQ